MYNICSVLSSRIKFCSFSACKFCEMANLSLYCDIMKYYLNLSASLLLIMTMVDHTLILQTCNISKISLKIFATINTQNLYNITFNDIIINIFACHIYINNNILIIFTYKTFIRLSAIHHILYILKTQLCSNCNLSPQKQSIQKFLP